MSDSNRRELVLETKDQLNLTPTVGAAMVAPPIDEAYWTYRVRLTDNQAIVGFPKFLTIGIGFAAEADWNTNLPYTCDAAELFEHIKHNKGDDSIPDDDVIAAIRMVQRAAAEAQHPDQPSTAEDTPAESTTPRRLTADDVIALVIEALDVPPALPGDWSHYRACVIARRADVLLTALWALTTDKLALEATPEAAAEVIRGQVEWLRAVLATPDATYPPPTAGTGAKS